MTIKIVTICAPTAFVPMDQCETRSFDHFPQDIQLLMNQYIADGKFPTTKQPEDSVVIAENGNIVITRVWLDEAAANEWVEHLSQSPVPDVISRTVVVD